MGQLQAFGRVRAPRWGRALALAAVVGLAAGAGPAKAYQFGDILRGAASKLPMPSSKPAQPAPQQQPKPGAGGDAPGAMGLQAGTALPPLHKLGTDAVAVVEAASARRAGASDGLRVRRADASRWAPRAR